MKQYSIELKIKPQNQSRPKASVDELCQFLLAGAEQVFGSPASDFHIKIRRQTGVAGWKVTLRSIRVMGTYNSLTRKDATIEGALNKLMVWIERKSA